MDQVTNEILTGAVADHGYRAVAAYGLPADETIAAYRAAYPSAKPGELLAAIETDWWGRIPALRLADAQVGGRSATYMYVFAWPSPAFGGVFGACRALEIGFVFNTLDKGPNQLLGPLLGIDPPRQLATALHGAWVAFAIAGDPGWPKYRFERRTTMRFDTASTVV